jgi:hypothetical protein
MKMRTLVTLLFSTTVTLVFVGLSAAPAFAQGTNSLKAKHVIGLAGVKRNATGMLTIENGSLNFAKGTTKTAISASSISEVLQGDDTQRTIGGTVGTISMFGPYGSGRFLSLFRTKIDTLSLTYADNSGAMHGVVFVVPKGKGVECKRALLAQGAKTSVPLGAGVTAETAQKSPGAKQ